MKDGKRTFKLKCKHCGQLMNYSPAINFQKPEALIKMAHKRKRCVYCGKSFLVREVMRKVKNE